MTCFNKNVTNETSGSIWLNNPQQKEQVTTEETPTTTRDKKYLLY